MATRGDTSAAKDAAKGAQAADFLAGERGSVPSTGQPQPAVVKPAAVPTAAAGTASAGTTVPSGKTSPPRSGAKSNTSDSAAAPSQDGGDSSTSSEASSPRTAKSGLSDEEIPPVDPILAGEPQPEPRPSRRYRCSLTFFRRVGALPAVQTAARIAGSAYDKVKHSTRLTQMAFSVAETGAQLVAGPSALAAVPLCVVMAVPICVADFGLNRTMDVVEYFAPCIKYDSEQAKKAAARLGVRIVTLPETAVATTLALLDTCPGKVVVKIAKTSTSIAGKTVDLFIYVPKSGENAVCDTVYRYVCLPYHVAQRIMDAAEHGRAALRDQLAEMS